jgi:hypothetical protein
MHIRSVLIFFALGLSMVYGADSIQGEWTVDLKATITVNYPTMKAENPNIADIDMMLKSASASKVQEKIVIDEKNINVLVGDKKVVYAIMDSWIDGDSAIRFVRAKAVDGVGHESLRTFIFAISGGNLKVYDVSVPRVMAKVYTSGVNADQNGDVMDFLETARKFESIYQAGSYDDDDGNGKGNYCFNADLLFGAAMGDAKALAFLSGLDPDLKRRGQFQYKALVNDGWKVTVVPEGTGNNAREVG